MYVPQSFHMSVRWPVLISLWQTDVSILTVHGTVCKQVFSHDRCNISFQLIKANDTFLSSLKKSDVGA